MDTIFQPQVRVASNTLEKSEEEWHLTPQDREILWDIYNNLIRLNEILAQSIADTQSLNHRLSEAMVKVGEA